MHRPARSLPRLRLLAPLLVALALAAAPAAADAFCGFYVSGADAKLYNNATMVVLMRDGTRTVLSMQNNYQGPPQDFAMVVPVPVVLQEKDVKTLPPAIFDRVDQLAAPRLVEYWEQDPCQPMYEEERMFSAEGASIADDGGMARKSSRDLGVTIEAKFEVGEYQIVVLGARDAAGLDTWLRQNNYKIPAGAEPVLRPYVQAGMKFFVARVDARKVRFVGDQAQLSPLRFHYDTPTFALPVRLGLINSSGVQDLLVHILARGVRYEAANYPNVAIPTNIEVNDATRRAFGPFYAALFDRVSARTPGAVVTEYAWSAGSCDPCPQEPLNAGELATLGADVLPTYERALRGGNVPSELAWQMPSEFVLTRLHARYDRASLGEDLVFQAAPPIIGGREMQAEDGKLEQGARPSSYGENNFQARYIIRHPWTGPIACAQPRRGIWGGPPAGVNQDTRPAIATDLAFVARDARLESYVAQSIPELELTAAPRPLPSGPLQPPPPEPKPTSGCARCALDLQTHDPLALFGLLALLGLRRRR
jgi:hypothetical protein